jgi:HK97 family phage prohead protease
MATDIIPVKDRIIQYKAVMTEVKDISQDGTVVFYAAVFNSWDRTKDNISEKAFNKTIQENFAEIQHYKNHDPNEMVGVLRELSPDPYGLKATSKLILATKEGHDTYEQYKAMADAGRSMPHSIGYAAVKSEKVPQGRMLHEVYLGEVSTLTKRPAHPGAVQVSVKDMPLEDIIAEEKYYSLLLNCKFDEVELSKIEEIRNHLQTIIEVKSRATTQSDDNGGVNWELISKYL